jgi:hypothetical protein
MEMTYMHDYRLPLLQQPGIGDKVLHLLNQPLWIFLGVPVAAQGYLDKRYIVCEFSSHAFDKLK